MNWAINSEPAGNLTCRASFCAFLACSARAESAIRQTRVAVEHPVPSRTAAILAAISLPADHIAVSHLERSGNPLPAPCERIALVRTGDVKSAARRNPSGGKGDPNSAQGGKLIVLEILDFTEKNRTLEAVDPCPHWPYPAFGQAIRAVCSVQALRSSR
jgi:hypothetical protein